MVKCTGEGTACEFDTSRLNSEGKLVVTGIVNAISGTLAGGALVDVFTPEGVQLRTTVSYGRSLDGLPAGIYVIGVRTADGRTETFKVTKR